MQWTLSQKVNRALLIRMALFSVLWLVVAFVFATEFYLSARGMPVEMPWTSAVGSAFRDWFPWMLFSPAAVILAGRFRFARGKWRCSLIVHLAACCFFAVAYEGLLLLAYPSPLFLSGGSIRMSSGHETMPPAIFLTYSGPFPDASGVISNTGDMVAIPPGLIGFGGAPEAASLPLPAVPDFTVVAGRGPLYPGEAPMPVSTNSDGVLVVTADGRATSFPRMNVGPGVAGVTAFRAFPAPSRWTHFLHAAVMKTQFTVPIYLCIVCVCWVLNHIQETGERERRTLELEARLTQANLHALRMQLQPHFLFNTLTAISSLIHENPKMADEMVGSLGQFLRTTLDMSSESEVPLREELEFVDRYLQMQQTRFGDRLRIHREIDSQIMDAMVPPLILQPLVENAIRYGIESREAGGTVTILARREADALRLEISDDGAGFSGAQLFGIRNGIGLSNTKTRLQELYGDRHQFKLIANDPAGARVVIQIPFRVSPGGSQNVV